MMNWIFLAFTCISLVLCDSELNKQFMNCKGNDGFWHFFRRCCESDLLPNGCECFDASFATDFTNTMFYLPKCPGDLDVKFLYYDRDNKDTALEIRAAAGHITASPFDGQRRTVVVAHGFTDKTSADWVVDMKDQLLEGEDLNVILIDWQKGAKAPNYYQASANTRTVGAMLGRLIQELNTHAAAGFDSFHLAGHSLGAHVMGYAGKEVYRLTGTKIGRITGLDPAGPCFESYSHYVRLDAEDAVFVDIIHTDAEVLVSSGFGTRYSIGHVDFYPNGGHHQPGCPAETYGILSIFDLEDGLVTVVCSHIRAAEFFTNSITRCRYDPPGPDGSLCTMGYHTDPSCRGDFYPTTSGTEPFC